MAIFHHRKVSFDRKTGRRVIAGIGIGIDIGISREPQTIIILIEILRGGKWKG